MAPAPDPFVDLRKVTPGLRRLFAVAGGLVLVVGTSLFVLPESTERNFAWTIATPLTAAFLGANYLAAMVFEWAAARERLWSRARVAVSPVLVFTVLTLIVTILHLDRFHFGSAHPFVTRLGTWLWTLVYVLVPVVMVVLVIRQHRVGGDDPPRSRPLPGWVRAAFAVQGGMLLLGGLALLFAPTEAAWIWPWPVTVLTGRAIAAWLLGIGAGMVHALVENDFLRIRVGGASNLVVAVLQLVALARYPGDVSSTTKGAAYVVFLLVMLVLGLRVLAGARQDKNGQL